MTDKEVVKPAVDKNDEVAKGKVTEAAKENKEDKVVDEYKEELRAKEEAAKIAAKEKKELHERVVAQQTDGPYDSLLSMTSLVPGETGWLSLDENGTPIGLHAFPPEPGADVRTCPVSIHDGANGGDKITTIAGAPLTDHMQPTSEKRFVSPDEQAIVDANVEASPNRFDHSHENVRRAAEQQAAAKKEPTKAEK